MQLSLQSDLGKKAVDSYRITPRRTIQIDPCRTTRFPGANQLLSCQVVISPTYNAAVFLDTGGTPLFSTRGICINDRRSLLSTVQTKKVGNGESGGIERDGEEGREYEQYGLCRGKGLLSGCRGISPRF